MIKRKERVHLERPARSVPFPGAADLGWGTEVEGLLVCFQDGIWPPMGTGALGTFSWFQSL